MKISNETKAMLHETVKDFLLVGSVAEEKFEIMLYDLGLNAVQMVDIKREIMKLTVNELNNAVKFIVEYAEIIQGEKAGSFTRRMA
jgi:hypothetical protein